MFNYSGITRGGFTFKVCAKLPEHQSYNLHMKKDERLI
jgi:hypothetical protein